MGLPCARDGPFRRVSRFSHHHPSNIARPTGDYPGRVLVSDGGLSQEAGVRARVLLVLLVVGVIMSAGTACRKRAAAPPAVGKESTTVDTTKKT